MEFRDELWFKRYVFYLFVLKQYLIMYNIIRLGNRKRLLYTFGLSFFVRLRSYRPIWSFVALLFTCNSKLYTKRYTAIACSSNKHILLKKIPVEILKYCILHSLSLLLKIIYLYLSGGKRIIR